MLKDHKITKELQEFEALLEDCEPEATINGFPTRVEMNNKGTKTLSFSF